MRLILPHLPNKLDVVLCSYLRDFCDFPAHFFPIKVEMNAVRKITSNPIDLNTIFGVIRAG